MRSKKTTLLLTALVWQLWPGLRYTNAPVQLVHGA
jgi:hypothetical protein